MPPFDVKAARAIRRAACASLAQQGERAAEMRATAARIRADHTPCNLTQDDMRQIGAKLAKEKT